MGEIVSSCATFRFSRTPESNIVSFFDPYCGTFPPVLSDAQTGAGKSIRGERAEMKGTGGKGFRLTVFAAVIGSLLLFQGCDWFDHDDSTGSSTTTSGSPIAAGFYHSVAIKSDSSIRGFGFNSFGQLADNTTVDKNTPVAAKDSAGTGNLTGAVAVTATYHTVALMSDGTLWAWGYQGRLGDNTTTANALLPVRVKNPSGTGTLSGIVSVSAGETHTLALKDDKTVLAWGDNGDGQIGDNTSGTGRFLPVPVKDPAGTGLLSSIVALSAGGRHSLAVKSDGTVWAWGRNTVGQLGDGSSTASNLPIQVKDPAGSGTLSGITAVAAGDYHSVVRKSDGTVWAWGENYSGKLGDNTATSRTLPVQVTGPGGAGTLTNVSAISAGCNHTVALKNDGTVWAWGYNSRGELGNNTTTPSPFPVQVVTAGSAPFGSVAYISAGCEHTMAQKTDGTIWVWGNGDYGQLGDGTSGSGHSSLVPVQVP
jgi:alpha-tubulin suppressor-like RCC1 family protein